MESEIMSESTLNLIIAITAIVTATATGIGVVYSILKSNQAERKVATESIKMLLNRTKAMVLNLSPLILFVLCFIYLAPEAIKEAPKTTLLFSLTSCLIMFSTVLDRSFVDRMVFGIYEHLEKITNTLARLNKSDGHSADAHKATIKALNSLKESVKELERKSNK